jgi:hypothetical protein
LPEWLIERGIGEVRSALIEDGEIVEARVELDGIQRAGTVLSARLIRSANRNAVARDETGTEYLLPRGAPGVTEGATLTIEVTREAIPGTEPWKRPMARVPDQSPRAVALIAGRELPFPSPKDELAQIGWNDLIEQARTGVVAFAGGELRISPTPAMTLIDVDGHLPPDDLAVTGATEAAKAIRRLDIGGSIGIDLPTVGIRGARQRAAAAIDGILPRPFERTAVNGFGFVQIVRPKQRASLVELGQDKPAFEARALLRRAALQPPGAKRLVAHPAVIGVLEGHREWLDALALQIGGAAGLRADPALPMSGAHAESV